MKTTSFITAIILCLASTISTFASDFQKTNESYVDDIPFNTRQIFDSVRYQQAITASFIPEEESFIEDIPFDTEKIVLQYYADSAMQVKFRMPEEKTINDFPFNTSYIARHQNSFLTNLRLF